MLTVRILCVGKCKEKYWREACAEYGKRLSAFCRFEVLEVDEERLPERPSKAQIENGFFKKRAALRSSLCASRAKSFPRPSLPSMWSGPR